MSYELEYGSTVEVDQLLIVATWERGSELSGCEACSEALLDNCYRILAETGIIL